VRCRSPPAGVERCTEGTPRVARGNRLPHALSPLPAAVAVQVYDAWQLVGAPHLGLVMAALNLEPPASLQLQVAAAVRHAADTKPGAGQALLRAVLGARGSDH
jgi:hypothetical protein